MGHSTPGGGTKTLLKATPLRHRLIKRKAYVKSREGPLPTSYNHTDKSPAAIKVDYNGGSYMTQVPSEGWNEGKLQT